MQRAARGRLSRADLNTRTITDAMLTTALACYENNLEQVVGGGISADAIDALREVAAVRLDRFETRKVVFEGAACRHESIRAGIANAVDFELMWLEIKRDYYQRLADEDSARIQMMRARNQQFAPRIVAVA